MKVVVTGGRGLLATHLAAELPGALLVARADCDIGDLASVARVCDGADAVINCAAYTNVDSAETNEDEAYRCNALGAENVARVARDNGAFFLQVSTDFVFDGQKATPYDEFDRPNPRSVYARSKWAGEKLALAIGGRVCLVRVQGLYGDSGKNFSSKLRELILAKKPLKLDSERRVQPTWARSAARQIAELVRQNAAGTYHVSCKGAATWAEFARHVADKLGVERNWQEVPTSALSAAAARPPNCLFHHRMLALRGLDVMPDWRAALDEYLEVER